MSDIVIVITGAGSGFGRPLPPLGKGHHANRNYRSKSQ